MFIGGRWRPWGEGKRHQRQTQRGGMIGGRCEGRQWRGGSRDLWGAMNVLLAIQGAEKTLEEMHEHLQREAATVELSINSGDPLGYDRTHKQHPQGLSVPRAFPGTLLSLLALISPGIFPALSSAWAPPEEPICLRTPPLIPLRAARQAAEGGSETARKDSPGAQLVRLRSMRLTGFPWALCGEERRTGEEGWGMAERRRGSGGGGGSEMHLQPGAAHAERSEPRRPSSFCCSHLRLQGAAARVQAAQAQQRVLHKVCARDH